MPKKPHWSKIPVTLTVGMKFHSPWLGNGTIHSFYVDSYMGQMVNVYWDSMGIVQCHDEGTVIYQVRLGLK